MENRPSWHQYFMALSFITGMRSIDAETKVGCIIVDWKSKIVLGSGYNAHPRKSDGLPTKRPDKYPYMIHAEANAILNSKGNSEDAYIYLPMPPCESCLGLLLNHPSIKVTKIIYYKYRQYVNSEIMLNSIQKEYRPCLHKYDELDNNDPFDLLKSTITYMNDWCKI